MDGKSNLYLAKMTSPEIEEFSQDGPIAILPVGSIEQHGPHLPIDTDLHAISHLARASLLLARKISRLPVGAIAPAIPYGGSGLSMTDYAGTLTLEPTTFINVVVDIGGGLVDSGFQYIVVMNGCYGNLPALTLAVQILKKRRPAADFILVNGDWESSEVINQVRTTPHGGMGHACELETSIALAIDKKNVDMELAEKGHLLHPSPKVSFDFDQSPPFYWPYQFKNLTSNGIIGDPTHATVEKGERIVAANNERVAEILLHIIGIHNSPQTAGV